MKYLRKIDEIVAILLFLVLIVVGVLQVLFRFVLNLPLDWSEEIIRFSLVFFIYVSTIISVKEGSAIRIELVDLFVKNKAKLALDSLINLISGVFMAFLGYQIIFLVQNAAKVNQTSPSLQLPIAKLYVLLLICFAFIAIMFGKQCVVRIKKLRLGDNK